MADVIRFVDSIDASPTVRLDLNDEGHFWTKKFDATLPRLRRSMSSNAMRDGIAVGSATYDGRTLVIELETIHANQDLSAIQIQKLWRELDRPTNILMYQPDGLTKPVFFRTFRSDTSQLEDVMAQAAMRRFTIEVLAEPFALGLKESLGPYTISNNPAAASNPCYVNLPTILGDVASDLVYWDNASGGSTYMSRVIVAHAGGAAVASVIPSVQCESAQAAIDTANPGGGPDAAMSGTATNNFLRTSFATSTILNATRVAVNNLAQPAGSYRIIAAVRRSGTTSAIQARVILQNEAVVTGTSSVIGETVTLPLVTTRQLVDLGVFPWPDASPVGPAGVTGSSEARVIMQAGRTGGSDTLDWDAVFFLPASEQVGDVVTTLLTRGPTSMSSSRLVVDGSSDQVFMTPSSSDPTTTAIAHASTSSAGGTPSVSPGKANRLYVLSFDGETSNAGVATTTTVNLAYWPRYKFVRPVSS